MITTLSIALLVTGLLLRWSTRGSRRPPGAFWRSPQAFRSRAEYRRYVFGILAVSAGALLLAWTSIHRLLERTS